MSLDAYRQLTDRQQRVLAQLWRGRPRVEIASVLGVKPRLVDADIAVIYRAFDLDDSGLTPAQRRFELRHYLQRVRKGEKQKTAATTTAPTEPSTSLPTSTRPSIESPSTPTEELKEAELSAPTTAPLASAPPWRWWLFTATVVGLFVVVSMWRVMHPPRPTTVASATITPSTRPTVPTVVLTAMVMSSTAAPSPTMTPVPPSPTTPQTPALAATTAVNPATSPVDLARKVESTLPGTSL